MDNGTKESRKAETQRFYKFLGVNEYPYFIIKQSSTGTVFYVPAKKNRVLAHSSRKGEAGLKACWQEFVAALTGKTLQEEDFRREPLSHRGFLEQETGIFVDRFEDGGKFCCFGFGNRRRYFQVSENLNV